MKIIFLIFFWLVGCGGSTPGGRTENPPEFSTPPTYSEIQAYILQPKCYACHSGGGGGGYNLSYYSGLMTRVISFDAAGSLLFQRVNTGSMPQGGPPLSPTELEAIEDWIDLGAENN